jgi:hypothetical protein
MMTDAKFLGKPYDREAYVTGLPVSLGRSGLFG